MVDIAAVEGLHTDPEEGLQIVAEEAEAGCNNLVEVGEHHIDLAEVDYSLAEEVEVDCSNLVVGMETHIAPAEEHYNPAEEVVVGRNNLAVAVGMESVTAGDIALVEVGRTLAEEVLLSNRQLRT